MQRFITCGSLVALVSFLFLPVLSQAQVWRQTVEVITPVGPDLATGALLDSLISRLPKSDIMLKRDRDDAQGYGYTELENQLFDEGFDLYSANQVFIGYRFENDQQGFRTTIETMYFIYRPEVEGDVDTPLMFMDATHPVVKNLLVSSGTQMLHNEAVFEPFIDQMNFHRLKEAVVVRSGNNIMRSEAQAEAEKRRITDIIRRFLY